MDSSEVERNCRVATDSGKQGIKIPHREKSGNLKNDENQEIKESKTFLDNIKNISTSNQVVCAYRRMPSVLCLK